jgi:pyruvate/2-oxoglutarate dehydrogenase complex dihydrolipoamide acyltransferase (E2) component
MTSTIEIKVPDIGDYTDVPVIEILVAVGDTVKKDQGLVTLESDKATLEVPSSAAGVVKELKVKLGDSLSEGSVVAILEAEGADASLLPPGEGGRRPDEGEGVKVYGYTQLPDARNLHDVIARSTTKCSCFALPSPAFGTLSRSRERGSIRTS